MKMSSIMKMLKCSYEAIGIDMKSAYQKTDLLLKIYRKANWSAEANINDLTCRLKDNSDGTIEALTCLLDFTPHKNMEAFRRSALAAIQTKALVEMINSSAIKLREYPDDGNIYYSILEMKYFNSPAYSDDAISEKLFLGRSTYYRKKKEAVAFMGYILFGVIMPEYVNDK